MENVFQVRTGPSLDMKVGKSRRANFEWAHSHYASRPRFAIGWIPHWWLGTEP